MKPFDKFLLALALVTAIILGIIFLPVINSDLSKSLGSGAATFFGGLWVAVIVLFWLAVGIAALVALVKIWQMFRTQVIRDSKDGQATRVVIHGSQLVQVPPGGMDISEIMKMQQQQILQMQAYWKMIGSATTSMKNITAYLEQLEVVDADEEDDDEGTMLGTATPTKQIAPPRTDPSIITMHLSDDYAIPADDLLSGRKLIVGISGSGKSNSVGSYGEELGVLRVPFILGDTEDEYQPLCNQLWLPNGVLAGLGTRYPVNVDNAAQFGAYVLTKRLQVILNLQSYEMEEAALVMVGIIGGMREWEEALPNEDRIPCDFILEEAVTWLPQYVKESPLHGTETFAMLQGTFFNDMVRKGRKRGLGLTLVCQKIAELDNRAMQSDGKILHRQTEEADLERYRKMGITREESLSLQDGEAFLFSRRVSKYRIQMRMRKSPHGAKTPGIANLNKQRNFDEKSEISDTSRNDFGQATEPLRDNISAFRKPVDNGQNQVPEETKEAILALYKAGEKRTDIQDQLGLNGDEYWMIKTVCNEYDRAKEA